MALLVKYQLDSQNYDKAYLRVEHVSGTKKRIAATCKVYATSEDAENGSYIDEFAFNIDGSFLYHDNKSDDRNYLTQAYRYLILNTIRTTSGRLINVTNGTHV